MDIYPYPISWNLIGYGYGYASYKKNPVGYGYGYVSYKPKPYRIRISDAIRMPYRIYYRIY